jgi:CubicO group peptidase (beta-lactamase class C family)
MKHDNGSTGLNLERLAHLKSVIEQDIERKTYDGAVIVVSRQGQIGLHEAIGFADRASNTTMRKDHVFSIFSTTKALTNVLTFRCIERGLFALTTSVSDIIPEFSGRGREKITIYHLLTHMSGLPSVLTPKEGMYIDRLDEIIAALCENVFPTEPPGQHVAYSPMCNHALLGEACRRVDEKKRSYRDIVHEDLFGPLGMKDSSIGVRKDLRSRKIVPVFLDPFPFDHRGRSDTKRDSAFEEQDSEMPWVGSISTASDFHRFADMLRRGGEFEGERLVSPALLDKATRNQTGDKPNELYKGLMSQQGWEPCPAYIGIGFMLRGEEVCHHHFGTLTSPRTFGNFGAGSSLFWVDPERQMTFVCFTAGVMNEARNIERFQKLSDIAVSAAI